MTQSSYDASMVQIFKEEHGMSNLFSVNGTEQPCKQTKFIKGLLFLFSEIAFLIAFAVKSYQLLALIALELRRRISKS